MPSIDIGPKNFISGESTSDLIADRGFSPDSVDLNLTKSPGVLYFIESPTDRGGATLTGNIIASANDRTYLGNDKYFLDDEGAFYTLNGTTLTKRQTSASSFVLGTSDLVQFNLTTYATSTDSLHELTGSDLATCERLWGANLNSSFRHPLEIVESEMFVADKNVIYYLNNSGTTGTAFTLPPEVNVTSLRKHTDGRTLLAFTGETANFSHANDGNGYVYFCNPTTRDWEREVTIEAQVEGTRNVGGVVYCTWGKNFGYFNGSGLVPLKRLRTSATTYSHNISNMEDILVVRDGINVLAYGNLGAGNVWWNLFKNPTNTNAINNVSYKGDNVLLVSYSDGAGAGLLKEIDYDNSGVLGEFSTNRITFETKVHISKIVVFHELSDSAGTTAFRIHQRDLQGNISDATGHSGIIESVSYVNQQVDETIINTDIKETVFQLTIAPLTDNIGFKLVRIYHEPIK